MIVHASNEATLFSIETTRREPLYFMVQLLFHHKPGTFDLDGGLCIEFYFIFIQLQYQAIIIN